jgi:hypothetical protein
MKPSSIDCRANRRADLSRRARAVRPILVASAALLVSVATYAVLPLLAAGLGKQIFQQMIMNEVKGNLIATLARQGCKGAKLISLYSEAERLNFTKSGGPGLPAGLTSSTGAARGAMPSGLPSGATAAGASVPGMAGGAPVAAGGSGGSSSGGLFGRLREKLNGLGSPSPSNPSAGAAPGGPGTGASLGVAGGGIGMGSRPGMMAGGPPGSSGSDLAEMMARAQQQMGGSGASMTPEQMQRASQTMAQMQEAMSHPLSREETLEVFGELKGMGLLTDGMYSEARDCIVLADESAARGIGSSGAMFKSVILPQLADVRAKLAALPPEHKEQLAAQLSQALKEASASDRKAFREGLGRSFFPPEVVEKVSAQGSPD